MTEFDASTELIGTTNQLILNYDEKFNKNYDKIVKIDGTIQDKEQLIIKYNEYILKQERNILISKYLIFLFIIIGILILLYSTKIINLIYFIGLCILIIIIFIVIIYFSVLNHYNLHNINKRIQGLQVAMKDYSKKLLEDVVPEYTCPANCPKNDDDKEEEKRIDIIQRDPGDTLNIDPQLNVWEKGALPYNKYGIKTVDTSDDVNPNSLYEMGDEPKPFFGTTYPKSTYYECEWLGGGTRGASGLPLGGPTNKKKYSSIPCSYKPNMKLKNKYICESDPNIPKENKLVEAKCIKYED